MQSTQFLDIRALFWYEEVTEFCIPKQVSEAYNNRTPRANEFMKQMFLLFLLIPYAPVRCVRAVLILHAVDTVSIHPSSVLV